MGSRRMRMPVSAKIALASAGATVGTLTSPTPDGDSVDSIRWTSIFGIELHPHYGIAIKVLRDDLAAIPQNDLAPGGSTKPPQETAFDLRANDVYCHGTIATALEFLLSRGLDLDRVAPVERLCDL